MKKRRFADGGETDPDLEAANASDDPIAYMNKAKRWTDTEEAPAKRKVVTKEELEKSGLSLRDYMNKQQGLTRRSTPYTGTGGSGGGRGPTAEELESYSASKAPARRKLSDLMPSDEAIQKGLEIGLPAGAGASMIGRLAKGLAGRTAKPAAEAAQQTLAAPVKRIGLDRTAARAAEQRKQDIADIRAARQNARYQQMAAENQAAAKSAGSAKTAQQALPAPTLRLGLDRTAARAAEQRKQDIADMRVARQNARNQQMRAENEAAAEGASARAASARSAAERPELGGELRRGAQQTQFKSSSKAAEAKRTRKFDDDAGAEFKRGGSVQKYAKGGSVKGWGMARGCRAAKIV